ncbi:hypothetical protein BBJ28_00021228 [Nothophytophthora sp. Chile5]|nr:hypothetical protein BBJ28_00021228 [Nothophytophthora sp. Chile5]
MTSPADAPTATPAQVLEEVRFVERLADVEARLSPTLALATEGSLAKRNQMRRKLYHDSELIRVELEERMNEHGIENQWLTSPEMQEANKKLDAVRGQLKLDVMPASHSQLEKLYMLVRLATMALLLVAWFSAFTVLIPLKLLNPVLSQLGVKKNYLPMDLISWGTASLVCIAACTEMQIEGSDHLRNLQDSVVCMFSHSSNLDGFIVNGTSPVAFKELAISVNERGNSVCISPEGTRSKDGLLQEFKKGPFYLREDTKKNVVPAIVFGAYELWPPGRMFSIPGHTLVRYLPQYESNPKLNRNQNRLALRRIYLKAFTEDVPDHIGTPVSSNFVLKNVFYLYVIWAITYKVTWSSLVLVNSFCYLVDISYGTFMLLSLLTTLAGEVLMYLTC